MEFYPQIFFEAAHTASIFPFGNEAAYYAMDAFGNYNMALPFILAVAGAMLGHAFNWWLGGKLFRWKGIAATGHKHSGLISADDYAHFSGIFKKYVLILLLLCWMTLGNLVVVAAGFFGVRFKTAMVLVTTGLIGHYGWVLLT